MEPPTPAVAVTLHVAYVIFTVQFEDGVIVKVGLLDASTVAVPDDTELLTYPYNALVGVIVNDWLDATSYVWLELPVPLIVPPVTFTVTEKEPELALKV